MKRFLLRKKNNKDELLARLNSLRSNEAVLAKQKPRSRQKRGRDAEILLEVEWLRDKLGLSLAEVVEFAASSEGLDCVLENDF